MTENTIFNSCKEFMQELVSKNEEIEKIQNERSISRKKVFAQIEKNLLIQCTAREKEFLSLRTPQYSTILELVLELFHWPVKTSIPVAGSFLFNFEPLTFNITDSEFNSNGFFYDSGRDEIRNLASSIFEKKLKLPFTRLSFDHNEKYMATFLFAEGASTVI